MEPSTAPGSAPRTAGTESMDSTLKPTAVLLTGRLAGIVVAFSIPIVLARALDQSAFGTYKQLFLIYATLYGIAQLGMAESLFYFLPADPARAAWTYAASDLARTALCLLPVLVSRSLQGVLLGGAAFALLRFGAVIRILGTEFGHELRPDRSLLRTQLAYAMPFELAVLMEILQANLHQYAVSLHFDPATFAIYSVGCLQVPLVDLLAGTSCNVMMVKMGEDLRTGRGEAAVAAWHATVRKLALAFFPLVAILLVNARDLIVFLFTARYLGSVPIFMVWTASFLLMTLPVDGVLRVHADTRFLFLLGAVKLLIIGATVGWFLGRFQLLGGVFVSLLAVLVGKSLALFRVKRHLKVTWSGLMPWSSLAATLLSALAAALPALLVKDTLALPPVASMLVSGVVYLLAYAALAGGFIDSGLRRRLVSILEAQR